MNASYIPSSVLGIGGVAPDRNLQAKISASWSLYSNEERQTISELNKQTIQSVNQ